MFSVDVFNEVSTFQRSTYILMLRPTESATIFLQQLGRGLRRTEDKPVLTVLDFVGHQREEFRWDLRLRAMTGRRRSELSEGRRKKDFPFLPSGVGSSSTKAPRSPCSSNLGNNCRHGGQTWWKELRVLATFRLPTFSVKLALGWRTFLSQAVLRDRGLCFVEPQAWRMNRRLRSALLPSG